MKKILLILLLTFTTIHVCFGQQQSLKFNANKKFKIVQFTDLHLDLRTKEHPQTLEIMRSVLKQEQPDFIIITGDLIWAKPARKALLTLTKPVVEANVPWTIAFGNHDVEFDITKEDAWKLFQSLPNFVGETGTVTGVGNNVFPIYSSDGKGTLISSIFTLDSHSDSENRIIFGSYDWIKYDQVAWYRQQSDKLAALNNNSPLPALMFFHIPIPEYRAVDENEAERVGEKFEGVADSHINSGLFASLVDKKNVMGVFVGHDHNNNYIGLYKDIALGFGQVTGVDAYGTLERGGRVIELDENHPKTFKTWVTTPTTTKHPFYYPSGLSEPDKNTQILPAQKVSTHKNGVRYRYFENTGKLKSVDDILKLKAAGNGVLPNFSLSPAKQEDHFAFTYNSCIKIPETGLYKFYIYSDDGAKLYIDGKLIVDNDGSHSARYREGRVGLEKGFHKLEVRYFEDYMGQELEVGMLGIDIPRGKIPDEILFVE